MSQPNLQGCPEFRRNLAIDRRGFVKAGVLGMAGLSLTDLLKTEALAGPAKASRNKSVIILWKRGGPSQHETWDPKPDAPQEYRGAFGAMSTKVPGIQICDLLPKCAKVMDKFSIIRSLRFSLVALRAELESQPPLFAVPLEEQYRDSGLMLNWVGNVQYDELPRWYGEAEFLVFPTLGDEWGLVVNEALAAGLPVIGLTPSRISTRVCTSTSNAKGAPVLAAGFSFDLIGHWMTDIPAVTSWLWLSVGAAALIGHVSSVFLGFKGGKGVAHRLGRLVLAPGLPLRVEASWEHFEYRLE